MQPKAFITNQNYYIRVITHYRKPGGGESRGDAVIQGCHQKPRLYLCSTTLLTSWSQKGYCCSRHHFHIPRRRKARQRGNNILSFYGRRLSQKTPPPPSRLLLKLHWLELHHLATLAVRDARKVRIHQVGKRKQPRRSGSVIAAELAYSICQNYVSYFLM